MPLSIAPSTSSLAPNTPENSLKFAGPEAHKRAARPCCAGSAYSPRSRRSSDRSDGSGRCAARPVADSREDRSSQTMEQNCRLMPSAPDSVAIRIDLLIAAERIDHSGLHIGGSRPRNRVGALVLLVPCLDTAPGSRGRCWTRSEGQLARHSRWRSASWPDKFWVRTDSVKITALRWPLRWTILSSTSGNRATSFSPLALGADHLAQGQCKIPARQFQP